MPDRVHDLIEKCAASRSQRKSRYATLRQWYLRGSNGNEPARYDKLLSFVELLASHLYAPDTTRFYVKMPPATRAPWLEYLDTARDEFDEVWRDSGADVMYSLILEWATVYGAAVAKVLPDPDTDAQVAYVHPGDFGVLREDLGVLDRQDVMAHWFSLTVPDIMRMVKGLPHEKEIVAWAQEHAQPGASGESTVLPTVVQQVIVSNVTGTFPNQQATGITDFGAFNDDDRAAVEEPLVELCELWERADFTQDGKRYSDFLVSTVIGDWTIMERRNPVLPHTDVGYTVFPGEAPFVNVQSKPMLDYFWGRSRIVNLLALQKWRESRMTQIDDLMKVLLDPSLFDTGMMGVSDQHRRALRTPGGFAAFTSPQGKVEQVKREMPQDAYNIIREIDGMFNDSAGITASMQGENEQGIRAGEQFSRVATVGSSRVRRSALITEDALEVLATKMFRLKQRRDDTEYEIPGGKRFLLGQLGPTAKMKVSAHTSSPIYAEMLQQKADRLLKAGAIDLVDYVELIDPPMKEALKQKARKLMEQKAEMAKKMIQIQEEKARRKGR